METHQNTTMYSVEGMRKFVCDRLTEAAQEILGVFEKRAQDYELELSRLRRLLDSVYTPEIKQRRTDLDLAPQIKEEQNDVIISEIQQPSTSTSVQDVHSDEFQDLDAEQAQNSTRKEQNQATTSHKETPDPGRPHTPEPLGNQDHIIQNNSSNTRVSPTKLAQSPKKCSHGYRLPRSYESKESNSSRNDKRPTQKSVEKMENKSPEDTIAVQSGDIPLDENTDPPPMQIIEIIDISPASSDIEMIHDDKETHNSKSGKKSSPQCCPIPKQKNQDDISDNRESATMTNNTGNTSITRDFPSTSTNIPSEWSQIPAVEEHITLLEDVIQNEEHISENSTGNTTDDKSLHGKTNDEERATESQESPSKKKTASSDSESMANKNYNAGKCTEPELQRKQDEQRMSSESTEQTTINNHTSDSSAPTLSNRSMSSKRKNYEDATSYVHTDQPILKQRCAEDIGRYTTNPEKTQSENISTAQNVTASSKKTSENNPFECDRCGKVLRNFKNYKFHMKSHTVEKSFKCDTCGKMFRESWDLNKHLIIHTEEKPFKCKDCGRGFNRRFNLDLHSRIHTGEKPYACSSCEKAFTSRVNLKKHDRIHTGEKPYTCDHCGKDFADSSSFRNHQRVHTGEKPYKCSSCKKRFATRTTLKRHLRVHTGEKPYKCSVCEKGFATNTDMKVHLRIHTGEKPYKCKNCGQNFSSWTNYNRHKNVHRQTMESSSTD